MMHMVLLFSAPYHHSYPNKTGVRQRDRAQVNKLAQWKADEDQNTKCVNEMCLSRKPEPKLHSFSSDPITKPL